MRQHPIGRRTGSHRGAVNVLDPRPAVRWVAVVGALASIAVLASGVSPAAAASTNFCPPAYSQMYLGGGGYCVSAQFYYLTRVQFNTANGNGVDHCAVGKQYSDGGGANVIPAACGTAQVQATPCVSARVGYAKGINNSASGHYFYGKAYYYDCTYSG